MGLSSMPRSQHTQLICRYFTCCSLLIIIIFIYVSAWIWMSDCGHTDLKIFNCHSRINGFLRKQRANIIILSLFLGLSQTCVTLIEPLLFAISVKWAQDHGCIWEYCKTLNFKTFWNQQQRALLKNNASAMCTSAF